MFTLLVLEGHPPEIPRDALFCEPSRHGPQLNRRNSEHTSLRRSIVTVGRGGTQGIRGRRTPLKLGPAQFTQL